MTVPYNGNFDITLSFTDDCAQIAMNANTVRTYVVPGVSSDLYSARFAYPYNANVFVTIGAAAPVIPPANSTGTQQYTELRPGADGSQRYVRGGQTIQFITPDATAYASVSLRKLP